MGWKKKKREKTKSSRVNTPLELYLTDATRIAARKNTAIFLNERFMDAFETRVSAWHEEGRYEKKHLQHRFSLFANDF